MAKFWHGVLTVPALVGFAATVLTMVAACTVGLRRSYAGPRLPAQAVDHSLYTLWYLVRRPLSGAGPASGSKAARPPRNDGLRRILLGIAYQYLPKLSWLAGCMLAGSIASILRPQNTQQIFLTIYAAWPVFYLYAWEHSAGKRQRRKPTERHGGTVSVDSASVPSD